MLLNVIDLIPEGERSNKDRSLLVPSSHKPNNTAARSGSGGSGVRRPATRDLASFLTEP